MYYIRLLILDIYLDDYLSVCKMIKKQKTKQNNVQELKSSSNHAIK